MVEQRTTPRQDAKNAQRQQENGDGAQSFANGWQKGKGGWPSKGGSPRGWRGKVGTPNQTTEEATEGQDRAVGYVRVSADGPAVIDAIHANPVRRGLGWVAHGFSRGGREYGWNSRPDRLGAVERTLSGGMAERAHSYG